MTIAALCQIKILLNIRYVLCLTYSPDNSSRPDARLRVLAIPTRILKLRCSLEWTGLT